MFRVFVLCLLTVLVTYCSVYSVDAVSVRTHVGVISGIVQSIVIDGQHKVVSKFVAIPFAEATSGDNRFSKPVPKAPFTTTFDATNPQAACVQSSIEGTSRYGKYVHFSEDCLSLNIYVPHDMQANTWLPVMVWIYGGSFTEGAAAIYPADVISTYGDVIVVSLNYRLGMFGFLRSADGNLVGNQGLWDQHLAIQWVHDNIAAFTGNPNDVTIFGESAGAASVLFQALYAGNKGLFQRVIAESGSALAYWANLEAPNAEAFIAYKGCDRGLSDPISCLRSMTTADLQYNEVGLNATIHFRPGVDNDFLVAHPHDIVFGNHSSTAAARNFFASLDIIVGVNNYDGALFIASVWPYIFNYSNVNTFRLTEKQFTHIAVPDVVMDVIQPKTNRSAQILDSLLSLEYVDWSKPNDSNSLRLSLTNLSSDMAFFYPAIATSRGHTRLRHGRTYVYEFSVIPHKHTLLTPSWIRGSNHADEIAYVFGYPLFNESFPSDRTYTDQEKQIARNMLTLWTNFAKSGNPNSMSRTVTSQTRITTWPIYDMTSENFLQVTNTRLNVDQLFNARRMTLWSKLIPDITSWG